MAARSYEIASAANAAGQTCTFILEWDDVSMRATGLRCVNDSDAQAYGEVVRISDGKKYSAIFLARTNTLIEIPTSPSGRITVEVHPSGDVIGYRGSFLFPYTG